MTLEYESQELAPVAQANTTEAPTVEVLAVLVITVASVALCSLSWWMALRA
jgi:hypothetical protein